jgi:hypothetical protein
MHTTVRFPLTLLRKIFVHNIDKIVDLFTVLHNEKVHDYNSSSIIVSVMKSGR